MSRCRELRVRRHKPARTAAHRIGIPAHRHGVVLVRVMLCHGVVLVVLRVLRLQVRLLRVVNVQLLHGVIWRLR